MTVDTPCTVIPARNTLPFDVVSMLRHVAGSYSVPFSTYSLTVTPLCFLVVCCCCVVSWILLPLSLSYSSELCIVCNLSPVLSFISRPFSHPSCDFVSVVLSLFHSFGVCVSLGHYQPTRSSTSIERYLPSLHVE